MHVMHMKERTYVNQCVLHLCLCVCHINIVHTYYIHVHTCTCHDVYTHLTCCCVPRLHLCLKLAIEPRQTFEPWHTTTTPLIRIFTMFLFVRCFYFCLFITAWPNTDRKGTGGWTRSCSVKNHLSYFI